MTIHSAKGIEFLIVIIPGFEDGIFPGMQTIVGTLDDMEEERRLAYVALTRAKEKIIIMHTKHRLLYGQTQANPVSRFVSESAIIAIFVLSQREIVIGEKSISIASAVKLNAIKGEISLSTAYSLAEARRPFLTLRNSRE